MMVQGDPMQELVELHVDDVGDAVLGPDHDTRGQRRVQLLPGNRRRATAQQFHHLDLKFGLNHPHFDARQIGR